MCGDEGCAVSTVQGSREALHVGNKASLRPRGVIHGAFPPRYQSRTVAVT